MRDKTTDFKTRQNDRFSKRDKTPDFQNGTKQPIFKPEIFHITFSLKRSLHKPPKINETMNPIFGLGHEIYELK